MSDNPNSISQSNNLSNANLANMGFQEILVFVDNLIYSKTGKHLSTLQVNIFKGAWLGHKYEIIAENNYCSEDYAKLIGSELWSLLSKTSGLFHSKYL
ncbi:MAG: hypothetical protein QNJ54_28660 [Prochloraceae cyanobacterium]|nr:hypothetical protein [Prochloraceae cyanobacterium]